MRQYDVHKRVKGRGYVVVVQSDMFKPYAVRVVVPLLPREEAPLPVDHLNPEFEVDGQHYVLVPHFIATVPVGVLGPVIMSASADGLTITRAVDKMLTGV